MHESVRVIYTMMFRCLFLLFPFVHGKQSKQAPNVVFIVADDLGYADIGYHNSYLRSPNIDELARSGVILNQSNVQSMCSPSRNAFMSGKYPFKTGLQHVLMTVKPVCLPLSTKLLPQYMKDLGYATHMVGKWHLGFCNWNCTPTYRGFDSFFGFYTANEDYYTHGHRYLNVSYTDFRDGTKPDTSQNGTYSANLFAERAVNIISGHNADQPLFLYVPFQSVHTPVEVPKQYENRCTDTEDHKRKKFCGMVAAMDEGVGNITRALKRKGLFENTIMIFTTDNGGDRKGSGYNYPLRGQKTTIWEGGTRGASFVHSPLLGKSSYINDGLLHATDWFSTIIVLGGGVVPSGVDGVDQSDLLLNGGESKRSEFVYHLDNTPGPDQCGGNAGIRMDDYKLLIGPPGSWAYDRWFVPPELTQSRSVIIEEKKIKHRGEGHSCGEDLYLFNIKDDPEERNNLYSYMPEMVHKMRDRLAYYYEQMVPALWPADDPNCDPRKHDGIWSPGWC